MAHAAAQELLTRRKARTHYMSFVQYVSPYYKADPFHIAVAEALEKVVRGETTKLMIFAPPQHGKTLLTSEHLPAFWLGMFPDDPVLIASYGARRAYDNSRKARNLLERPEYQRLFGNLGPTDVVPVETSDDSRAADQWALAYPHRGGVLAAGVGGAITGFGAKLAIIDDPVKDWKEAQSATIRESTWEWYQNTFLTRVWEGGRIVLIQTRWHEQDLAGRIIQTERDDWTILRFPAIAETQAERDEAHRFLSLPLGQADPLGRAPGEALAPHRFSAETLLARRSTSGWYPVYQQVPKPAEGDRFKRVWLEADERMVAAAPAHCRRVRYWDKAGSTSDSAKYTAGVMVAFDDKTKIAYIEDVVRGRWSALQREEIMRQTAEADAQKYGRGKVIIWIEQEPGSGGLESAQNTIRNLAGHTVKADKPTGDKDTRLEPFAAYTEGGMVRMVRGAWNTPFVDELAAIPNGAFRDQADAVAGAFNKLSNAKTFMYEIIG